MGRKARQHPRRGFPFWLLGLVLVLAWLGYEAYTLPDDTELGRLAAVAPRETALMRARKTEAAERDVRLRIQHVPVAFDQIAPTVVTALVASEDARFFDHEGLDLKQVRAAVEDTVKRGKRLRGASTLTQQLAKNLYLSESRSLLRKVKEAWIARQLEERLSKKRILTLYLNSVEWGDGVFGVEAAARMHLQKTAAELSLAEAALLVAMLPNPHRLTPKKPKTLKHHAERVLERMAAEKLASAAEVAQARSELAGWPAR